MTINQLQVLFNVLQNIFICMEKNLILMCEHKSLNFRLLTFRN